MDFSFQSKIERYFDCNIRSDSEKPNFESFQKLEGFMSESALLMRFSFDHREAIDCLFGQFYSQIANDTGHFFMNSHE